MPLLLSYLHYRLIVRRVTTEIVYHKVFSAITTNPIVIVTSIGCPDAIAKIDIPPKTRMLVTATAD